MEPEVLTKVEEVDSAIALQSSEAAEESGASNAPSPEDADEHPGHDAWESTSIYEELLDGEDETYEHVHASDVCTPEEAKQYRQRLREIGLHDFIAETLGKGVVSPQKLMTAFGVRLPNWFLESPEENSLRVLGLAMLRELNKRQRLPNYKTIDDAAALINKASNIVIVTGAGVSTSLGIPDFRSKTTGFYSKLRDMGIGEPEEVFDLQSFDLDPSLFYTLAGDILPDLHKWTPTHQFIRMIQDKGKLLRNYTQNIDNIESHAGILPEKLIQCHGSWAFATCRKCGHKVPGEQIFDSIKAKQVARCKRCPSTLHVPNGNKRKRSPNGVDKPRKRRSTSDDDDSDGQFDIPEPGIMKPDITFFGERLPDHFFETLQKQDRDVADLVIVLGTSMKVAPVSEIPQFLPSEIPQIYVSRDPINHINFDINLLGDCDTVVAELCKRAGWDLKHEMLPPNPKASVEPHEFLDHTYNISAVLATSGEGS